MEQVPLERCRYQVRLRTKTYGANEVDFTPVGFITIVPLHVPEGYHEPPLGCRLTIPVHHLTDIIETMPSLSPEIGQ